MFAIVPLTVGVRSDDDRLELGHEIAHVANTFAEPYQVPDFNFGWSATDACYSFGSYDLAPDEALVVTHRPPTCRFWNLIVWNQFMAGAQRRRRATSVNHGTAVPNADGTVTVVIARRSSTTPTRSPPSTRRGATSRSAGSSPTRCRRRRRWRWSSWPMRRARSS